MKKIYKKLFNISYKNKLFTIFLDENNRRTFLEINKKGNYSYPLLEDFIELNNFYNNYNPFIVNVQKYTFKEKVKKFALGSLVYLTVVGSAAAYAKFSSCIPHQINNNLILEWESQTNKEVVNIADVCQLDEILGYKSVSLEEIHEAIDNNGKIPLEYKGKIHLFITVLNNKYPNLDLRIFYENIKEINFNIVDEDYFNENEMLNISAQYDANLNQIIIPENISDYDFYHELAHTTDLFYREDENRIIYRGPIEMGTVLNEAMTNVTANCIAKEISYDKYGVLLEFFRNYVEFDYYTYNQKGIDYLIELLKEKYPSVDIEFIVCALDTISQAEKNNSYIYLDQVPDLLDELFKICEIELDKENENFYDPFNEFSKIIYYTSDNAAKETDILEKYLKEYNELLQKKDKNIKIITYDDIKTKLDKYKDIKSFIYRQNEVVPLIDSEMKRDEYGRCICYMSIYNKEGQKEEIVNDEYQKVSTIDFDLFSLMQLSAPKYYDIIGTNEYWEQIAIDYNYLKEADFKKIPIYFDGELLGNECIDDLYIAVGKNSNDEIGYIIRDIKRNIFYKSDDSLLLNVSNFLRLDYYLTQYMPKEFSSLELKNVLNDYYLRDKVEKDELFYNVMLKDDKLNITPKYKIKIVDGIASYNFDLGECYFTNIDGNIAIDSISTLDMTMEEKVYLKYILDYYGLLDENTFQYEFTKDELFEYYQNYINDISIDNNVGLGR